MKLYTCNACRYTFPAETLPDRCPDCGKATANVKVCIGGKNKLRQDILIASNYIIIIYFPPVALVDEFEHSFVLFG